MLGVWGRSTFPGQKHESIEVSCFPDGYEDSDIAKLYSRALGTHAEGGVNPSCFQRQLLPLPLMVAVKR